MTVIEVTYQGPLFTKFASIFHDICEESLVDVGDAALERVQYLLNRSIKNPTPYYETQIIHQQRSTNSDVVHDRGIIYGPWLEGTSTRNARTRFKGYSSFRKATQEVEKLAPAIVERVIARNIGRLQ